MTDTKISQLTDGGAITSGDLIPIARAGQNVSINGAKLAAVQGAVLGTTSAPAGAHKAWRLRIDNTETPAYCSLAELQFRTTSNAPLTATGGTAFASSFGNGSSANAAFDNDTGDRWVAAYPNTPFPKYIGYMYASPISVIEAAITASGYNTEAPTTFAVEYSDDTTSGLDGTWAQAGPTYTTPGTWQPSETRAFSLLTVASVGLVANVSALQANVATLQAGGAAAGGPPFCAGGTFEFAGNSTPTHMDVRGCTVTWLAQGRYQITFSSPMPDANYGVLSSGKWSVDVSGNYQTPVVGMDRGYDSATTVNGFYLIAETQAGGSLYDARVFFAVYKSATALCGF